jgi:hypothetical protein
MARDDRADAWRQSLAAIALAWAPIVAIAVLKKLVTGSWDRCVLEPAVHARLLVMVPLLLFGEQWLHALSVRCVDRLSSSGLVADGHAAIERVVTRGARLRDAWQPEMLMALAALAEGQIMLWGIANPLLASRSAQGWTTGPSMARVWWAVVSLPIAQFLLFRSLWRWVVWFLVLLGFAGLDIRPLALHPDRRGGLAFLSEPVFGFALVVMALCSAAAGSWGGRMLFDHMPLAACALPLSYLALAAFVVALGPLGAFSGCLWRARFAALREYHMFAITYVQLFHRKWIDAAGTQGPLGSSDIQSMADLAHTLDIVRGMLVVPFGLQEFAAIVIAIGLPMVPLVTAAIPLHEVLRLLLGAFVAGAP